MSFTNVLLDQQQVLKLRDSLLTVQAIGGDFDAVRRIDPQLFGGERMHVHIGVHSYTIIGEYIFLYEEGVPQHCFHIMDDSSELFKAFKLMCDHASAYSEEAIDLYEGFTVTSCVSTGRAFPSAGLDVVTELGLKAGFTLA